MTRRNAFILVLSIGLLWALADQWTKYLAVRDLTNLFPEDAGLFERLGLFFGTHGLYRLARPPVEVISGLWNHVYVQNPAGAFGLLSGASAGVRRLVFTGVALLASGGILWMATHNYGRGMLPTQIGLGLVFGGAVGNLVDRVLHGYVIDFIDWHVTIGGKTFHWPAFNIADVGIVVGVFGLFFLLNFSHTAAADDDKTSGAAGKEKTEAGAGGSA